LLYLKTFTIFTPYEILFGWSNKLEWNTWGMWHVACNGEMTNKYRLFGDCRENPEEKWSFGRPRLRWKDNI
jgi:hypothetical protein